MLLILAMATVSVTLPETVCVILVLHLLRAMTVVQITITIPAAHVCF